MIYTFGSLADFFLCKCPFLSSLSLFRETIGLIRRADINDRYELLLLQRSLRNPTFNGHELP